MSNTEKSNPYKDLMTSNDILTRVHVVSKYERDLKRLLEGLHREGIKENWDIDDLWDVLYDSGFDHIYWMIQHGFFGE